MKGKFVKEKHGDMWHIFFEEDEDSFQVESEGDYFVVSTNNPFQIAGLPVSLCQTYQESHADFLLEMLNGNGTSRFRDS